MNKTYFVLSLDSPDCEGSTFGSILGAILSAWFWILSPICCCSDLCCGSAMSKSLTLFSFCKLLIFPLGNPFVCNRDGNTISNSESRDDFLSHLDLKQCLLKLKLFGFVLKVCSTQHNRPKHNIYNSFENVGERVRRKYRMPQMLWNEKFQKKDFHGWDWPGSFAILRKFQWASELLGNFKKDSFSFMLGIRNLSFSWWSKI